MAVALGGGSFFGLLYFRWWQARPLGSSRLRWCWQLMYSYACSMAAWRRWSWHISATSSRGYLCLYWEGEKKEVSLFVCFILYLFCVDCWFLGVLLERACARARYVDSEMRGICLARKKLKCASQIMEFLRGNALISAHRRGKMRAGRREYARTHTEMRAKQRRNARKTQTCTFDICAPPTS
jgi:hypothetical protein